jgi:hypothetical protein
MGKKGKEEIFSFSGGTGPNSIRFDIVCKNEFAKKALSICRKAKRRVDKELGFQEKISLQMKDYNVPKLLLVNTPSKSKIPLEKAPIQKSGKKQIIFWASTLGCFTEEERKKKVKKLYQIFNEEVHEPLIKMEKAKKPKNESGKRAIREVRDFKEINTRWDDKLAY